MDPPWFQPRVSRPSNNSSTSNNSSNSNTSTHNNSRNKKIIENQNVNCAFLTVAASAGDLDTLLLLALRPA